MPKKRGKSKARKTKPMSPTESTIILSTALPYLPPLKLCRLCESKDGPFLNIFDTEQAVDKKIEDLMPFVIEENDDLPHKICFRCSAKVEELHEFIQKCIKTQENLRVAVGKRGPLITKIKTHRSRWEEKLNKSNISNDDICDAMIKKAMEGIKGVNLAPPHLEDKHHLEFSTISDKSLIIETSKNEEKLFTELSKGIGVESVKDEKCNNSLKEDSGSDSIKHANSKLTRDQKSIATRSSRSNNVEPLTEEVEDKTVTPKNKRNSKKESSKLSDSNSQTPVVTEKLENTGVITIDDEQLVKVIKKEKEEKRVEKRTEDEQKPFDIMDHVSTIKVNGVGVLFQCKLCNRNFLKKGIVKSHGCVRTGTPKEDFTKHIVPPEPPKVSTVKYINTKFNTDTQKSVIFENSDNKGVVVKKFGSAENILEEQLKTLPNLDTKPKHKIGPASKVRRESGVLNTGTGISPKEPPLVAKQNTPPLPVQFPNLPSLNCRYKLVPGPNNTYTLVEEQSVSQLHKTTAKEPETTTKIVKRKTTDETQSTFENELKEKKIGSGSKDFMQPYPVGLFQSIPKYSNAYTQPVVTESVTFSSCATDKQAFMVQTDNPTKILISAKPPTEEPPKKRLKKINLNEREGAAVSKDSEIFTFINVDPLLEPSYVLPVDSVQESQISTSKSAPRPVTSVNRNSVEENVKDNNYSCNMCGEKFSREQKLRAHIHSHYSKMDEEDLLRSEKGIRKRGRKS